MQDTQGSRMREVRGDVDQTRAEMSGTIGAIQETARRGLISDLMNEVTRYVRQEATLAKEEMTEKATVAGKDVGIIAAGGMLGFGAFIALVVALIELLATFLPRWLAAFVAGGALAGTGAALGKRGLDALRQEDLVPRQTLESVRETGQLAKEQV